MKSLVFQFKLQSVGIVPGHRNPITHTDVEVIVVELAEF